MIRVNSENYIRFTKALAKAIADTAYDSTVSADTLRIGVDFIPNNTESCGMADMETVRISFDHAVPRGSADFWEKVEIYMTQTN